MPEKLVRILLFTLFILILNVTVAVAQERNNEVALIISLENDQVMTQCVEFSEEHISGYEALNRTGLAIQTDIVGLGATVCQIEGSGCPADDCFCQCKGGGTCLYWSYWTVREGKWQYSQVGGSLYQVSDGDIQGWVWGIGSPNEAPAPPAITFEEICTPENSNITDNSILTNPGATYEAAEIISGDTATNDVDSATQVVSIESQTNKLNDEDIGGNSQWLLFLLGGMVVILVVYRGFRIRQEQK